MEYQAKEGVDTCKNFHIKMEGLAKKGTIMQTFTGICDTIDSDDLQRDVRDMEEEGYAVRQISGKWFLIGHGREASLAFSGAIVYERED